MVTDKLPPDYMLIDMTNLKILKRGCLYSCGHWGDLIAADVATYVGPFQNKTFSQFQEKQLMTLYKNSFGEELSFGPYQEMLFATVARARMMEADPTPLSELKRQLMAKYPADSAFYSPMPGSAMGGTQTGRVSSESGNMTTPKRGSTTGRVWEIADELYSANQDLKAIRKTIIERCISEGINQSTAATQYSRWAQTKR